MPTHTISSGECVVSIAKAEGYTVERIWEHPANARLREARQDGRVLAPGDVLTLPEREEKWERMATGRRHRLQRTGLTAMLRLRFVDAQGKARAGLRWVLDINGELFEGRTTGEGLVEHPLPPACDKATLQLRDGDDVEEYPLTIGALHPSTLEEGLLQRLESLGLLAPGERRPEHVKLAIGSLQLAERQEPTGILDEQTLLKAEQRYRKS